MKIIGQEEKDAHKSYVLAQGAKGMFYGSILSLGLFGYLKTKHAARFRSFNTSIKTCIIIMPTISMSAFWADQGSVEFDRLTYQSDYEQGKTLEEFREWNNMALSDKAFTVLNNNKYSIILASWAASMYGSWVYVNKDKVMTTAQKAVQARMYAQAITIVLLLGTLLLAMKEEEMNKAKPAPIPEWKKIIMEKEEHDSKILAELKKSKEEAQ